MSKVCAICGKGKMSGNLVSHSNRKTPKTYSANLKKVKVEINGKESTEYVCTRCIRTANKEER
ncbi:MAG: 50S ribosomal protein L28 [Candidatus Fimimonas sp.]